MLHASTQASPRWYVKATCNAFKLRAFTQASSLTNDSRSKLHVSTQNNDDKKNHRAVWVKVTYIMACIQATQSHSRTTSQKCISAAPLQPCGKPSMMYSSTWFTSRAWYSLSPIMPDSVTDQLWQGGCCSVQSLLRTQLFPGKTVEALSP